MKKNLQKRKEVIQWVGSQAMHRDHGTQSDTFLRVYYTQTLFFLLMFSTFDNLLPSLMLGYDPSEEPTETEERDEDETPEEDFYP